MSYKDTRILNFMYVLICLNVLIIVYFCKCLMISQLIFDIDSNSHCIKSVV